MKSGRCLLLLCLLTCLNAYTQDSPLLMRIMTYNIQHGAGTDDVIDLDRQAAVIQGAAPEVVGLQEVDSCVKRSGYVHQAAVLAKSLGMYCTFGPAIPLTGGKYGVAVLSREKPLSHHIIPLPGNEKRVLLVCEFQEYVFATTHLALEEENRLISRDIILEEAARWDKPFFICGDWNDTPTSPLITGLKKSFVFLNSITNTSANYTFPAGNPKSIIDYIACYGKAVRSIRKRQVLNEPKASDHRPVLVDVRFDGATGIESVHDPQSVIRHSKYISRDSKLRIRNAGFIYDLSGRMIKRR